jgi:predicted N-acetyltransferase YhbS
LRALARAPGREKTEMTTIRKERPPDAAAREELLDEAFGRLRQRKSSQRLRDGQLPANDLAFVATEGKRVIGTARLWNIACDTGQRALLLGPVAVAGNCRNRGVGAALVRHALAAARRHGHRAIILVGDAAYYGRFGFTAEKAAALRMPGPFERHRLLAFELVPNALRGARGLLRTANRSLPRADLAASAA